MRLERDATFRTVDGKELYYRYWPVEHGRPRGAILLFHRGHEHSGRVAHLVEELDLPDFALFAWDARGHGRSPGSRGHSPSVATSVADVQAFVDHVADRHGFDVETIAVIGQSLGATLLAGWAHGYAPRIRAMVLAAPALRVKLYVPFARPALRFMHAIRGDFVVNSFVNARLLTDDQARIASYESDPLITRAISVGVLIGLHDLAARVVADAAAITVPTQILVSGRDYVVARRPQIELYEHLGARTKELHLFDGFRHDTLGEKNRAPAVAHARRFLLERFEAPFERPSLLDADERGFTRREADVIAEPLARASARGLYWRLVRFGVHAAGRISAGIRLGITTGFDSGPSLDYVYRNVASGRTWLGRWIDRRYLDAIGWRGIRERKLDVEALIRDAVERVGRERRPVRIVDVAAGSGRYVLDAVDRTRLPDAIELRDYRRDNVNAGRTLIDERGLASIASFVEADALDPPVAALHGRSYTIGVVSGLYELYADNGVVRRSLEALAAEIEHGGYLIYTGQPWHPQLEFIARALTSHRGGAPWAMRRRTQAELDELVAAAGFTKIAERVGSSGIFTVCLARKTRGACSAHDVPAKRLSA